MASAEQDHLTSLYCIFYLVRQPPLVFLLLLEKQINLLLRLHIFSFFPGLFLVFLWIMSIFAFSFLATRLPKLSTHHYKVTESFVLIFHSLTPGLVCVCWLKKFSFPGWLHLYLFLLIRLSQTYAPFCWSSLLSKIVLAEALLGC